MRRVNVLFAVTGLVALAAPLAAQVREVTLPEAVTLAEKVQPRVVQAAANVLTADARLRSTRAAYFPNLSFSSSGSNIRADGPSRIDPITGEVVPGGTSNTSVSTSLNASVDLFTGFRRGSDIKAARANTAASDASLIDAKFQQRLATTNAFFNALAARQLLAVRQASVRRAEEQLKISVSKLAAGSATRSDSLRSRVTLGTAQLQLLQAQSDLVTTEAALARVIGETGRVQAADDSTYYELSGPIDSVALRSEAVDRSPQVQAARASQLAAEASLRSSRSAYYPTLTLGGNTSFSGSSNNSYHLYNQRQVSLQLGWNLFNRFGREQTIVINEAAAQVAAATAADLARSVETTLTGQIAALGSSRSAIDIAQVSVSAATEDLRVVQERYRLGAATIVDQLTSQEALNQAEIDVVNARFNYLRARAQIEALLGRSL